MSNEIDECVRRILNRYLLDLDGETPCRGIYGMVIASVEKPMLEVLMQHTEGNQSEAANLLGINRNTLRKKLGEHKLL